MFTARRRKSAFTLVEAMVAAAITAVGVAAAVGSIGSLERRQAKINDQEVMLRLAKEKFDEILAIQDFSTPSGDFTDRSDSSHLWQMTLNPVTLPATSTSTTTASPATNAASTANQGQIEMLTVTVHPSASSASADSESVSGIVWESQQAQNGASSGATP